MKRLDGKMMLKLSLWLWEYYNLCLFPNGGKILDSKVCLQEQKTKTIDY